MNGIIRFSKKALLVLLIPTVVIASTGMASKQFEISKQIDIFISMFEELHTYYVDEINTSQLFETGIKAMLESLDPYTNYISASEVENYKVMTTGEYGGIGAVISKEGAHILIVEPHKGYPAHQADMRAGDILLKVDDKSIKGKGTNEVSQLLKGEPDTEVDITIERPGVNDTLHKTLTRKNIEMPNVPYAGMIEDENVGYIRFSNFRKNASEEVKEELLNLKKRDSLRGLILDLRGNPGGILNEAVKTASWFVNKGQL
ncbi:MAG: peptidase S41, partial [Bacteroidetes bacterium SW_10_40_5]